MHNSQAGSSHSITVLLTVKPYAGDFGISFIKALIDLRTKVVKIHSIAPGSPGEKFGFKEGDTLLAINNIPVRNERQVSRMFTGLSTDIVVLVERDLNSFIDDNSEGIKYFFNSNNYFSLAEDVLISSETDPKEDFVCIGSNSPTSKKDEHLIKRSLSDIYLKKPNENISGPIPSNETSPSKILRATQSIPIKTRHVSSDSYSHSLPTRSELEVFQINDLDDSPKKIEIKPLEAEINRIPKLEIRQPSFDIRRSRSESNLESIGLLDSTIKNDTRHSGSIEFDKYSEDRNNGFLKGSSNDEPEKDIKDENHPKSRRERLHARASEMALKLNASAAKVGELWKNRHKTGSPSNTDVEFATEANEAIHSDGSSQV